MWDWKRRASARWKNAIITFRSGRGMTSPTTSQICWHPNDSLSSKRPCPAATVPAAVITVVVAAVVAVVAMKRRSNRKIKRWTYLDKSHHPVCHILSYKYYYHYYIYIYYISVVFFSNDMSTYVLVFSYFRLRMRGTIQPRLIVVRESVSSIVTFFRCV